MWWCSSGWSSDCRNNEEVEQFELRSWFCERSGEGDWIVKPNSFALVFVVFVEEDADDENKAKVDKSGQKKKSLKEQEKEVMKWMLKGGWWDWKEEKIIKWMDGQEKTFEFRRITKRLNVKRRER